MIGAPGTGKTTLLRKLLESLEPDARTAFLSQTFPEDTTLLHLVAEDFDLPQPVDRAISMPEHLRCFFLDQLQRDKSVALLVDEAQNLSFDCLEELQDLSAMRSGDTYLVQIVLAGQPELTVKLEQRKFAPLRQRIALSRTIRPLEPQEVALYMDARLAPAGRHAADLFEPRAIDAIADLSGGFPRVVNIICDQALRFAFGRSAATITAAMVEQVAGDLAITAPPKQLAVESDGVEAASAGDSPAPGPSKKRLFAVGIDHEPAPSRAGRIHPVKRWSIAAAIVAGVIGFGALLRREPNMPEKAKRASEVVSSETPARSLPNSQGYPVTASLPEPSERAVIPTAIPGADASAQRKPANAQPIERSAGALQASASKNPSPAKATPVRETPRAQFVVVSRSFVRAQPTADAEITATLEPGADIEVTGRSGEFFRVRALDVAGYVHREDAFFEKKR